MITVTPDYVTVSPQMRSCNTIYHVDEIDNVLNISVFPNPAGDKVTIECPPKARVEISTTDGLVIQRFMTNNHQTTLNLSSIYNGIYLVKVVTLQGTAIRKLMKL